MTNSLDDLILNAAEEVVSRPSEDEETVITLGEGDDAIEVAATALEAALAGIESVLTSPEFLQILDDITDLDMDSVVVEDTSGGFSEKIISWIEDVETVLQEVRDDAETFALLIRNELIPAVATMRGTIGDLEAVRAVTARPDMATIPGESSGNAAYDQLRRVRASQGIDDSQVGMDPNYDIQWAYATLAGLPSAMQELFTGTYGPSTTTTSGSSNAGGYAATPHGPVAAPTAATGPGMPVASGQTTTSSGGMSPAAQALAGAGAVAAGVARGSQGKTATSSGGTDTAAAAAGAGGKAGASGKGGKSGKSGKGGVSKSELLKMIDDAKKRIDSEKKSKPKSRPNSTRTRPNSPGPAPRNQRPETSTLDAMKEQQQGKDGAGDKKAQFLDIATTTPAPANPDSETTGAKPTPAAASGGGGQQGGMRGMGMMPMGGMMGAMNRMGQNGQGPGSGTGSDSNVPTDYNLEEVGKSSIGSVTGGVIRSGERADEEEEYVSPIMRSEPESEEEEGTKKRGLGNIFG